MWHKLQICKTDEKGGMSAILAFTFLAVLGISALVIDVGTFFVADLRLSNHVDSAALAGAQELNRGELEARETAREYALKNGLAEDEVEVTVNNDLTAVTVQGRDETPIFFGRFLVDEEYVQLEREVTAGKGQIGATSGVAPLGIKRESMEGISFGDLRELKVAAGDDFVTGPGNFGAVALGGTGANIYRDNLREGYQELLEVGDIIETEPGNIAGPTDQAMRDRLGDALSDSHEDIPKGCPRVFHLPVIEVVKEDSSGRHELEIVGFAAFWIENNPHRQGDEVRIEGRFVELLTSGDIKEDAGDFGVEAVRLLD